MKRDRLCFAVVLMAIFFICIMSTTLPGFAEEGIFVQSYRADLYLNGTLQENYVYRIEEENRYRMLYRPWKLPLSSQKLDYPYVEPLTVDPPQGSIPYAKDRKGKVTIFSSASSDYEEDIQSLAELNEVGCYNPRRFPPGVYNISYLFKVHPSLECDASLCHWNLRLADDHYPYQQVAIYIHDQERLLVHLIPHPDMYYKKEGDVWAIIGSSPENGLLEVEMLLSPNASAKISGFAERVSNIKQRTISAQHKKPSSDSSSDGGGVFVFLIFAAIVGFIILANWRKGGSGGGSTGIGHRSWEDSSHSGGRSGDSFDGGGGRSGGGGSFGGGGERGGGGGRAR